MSYVKNYRDFNEVSGVRLPVWLQVRQDRTMKKVSLPFASLRGVLCTHVCVFCVRDRASERGGERTPPLPNDNTALLLLLFITQEKPA